MLVDPRFHQSRGPAPPAHPRRTAPLHDTPPPADDRPVSISPVSTNLPDAIKSPADALAFLAVKKGLDAQKSAAAALISLLDPNVGRNLNASA